eukprot:TRINITY_DN887_c0_g1_i3.p1 TRINITY_DN887_c0_g1~~TRINITY_DN887_c0_g1_i3.p1  ORF type:complete len:166 (-),score=27.59 TRINITY_DN887_c0_g1_i3:182-679(-)
MEPFESITTKSMVREYTVFDGFCSVYGGLVSVAISVFTVVNEISPGTIILVVGSIILLISELAVFIRIQNSFHKSFCGDGDVDGSGGDVQSSDQYMSTLSQDVSGIIDKIKKDNAGIQAENASLQAEKAIVKELRWKSCFLVIKYIRYTFTIAAGISLFVQGNSQ